MRTYKHLTMTDRLRIEKWLKMGMKPREIADKLRVHVSTIYRELKRGETGGLDRNQRRAYNPVLAQQRVQENFKRRGKTAVNS